jgi:SPP1 family predicted phage head-tail adaptor
MGPMINAGTLDKRAKLLRPRMNPAGDEIIGWEEVAEVWAGFEPASKPEIDASGRTVSLTSVKAVIRYRADVAANWRLRCGGREYTIQGKADIGLRHVRLELDCQEVQ